MGLGNPVRLAPGTLIVLEGLDRAGKSTTADQLRSLTDWSPAPGSLHMPSGRSSLTRAVYAALEKESPTSGLGRQLFHLACHAEAQSEILELQRDGLLLDRWWWSTLAYSAELPAHQRRVIEETVHAVWEGVHADLVVCFLDPFIDDPNNAPSVEREYRRLVEVAGDGAVVLAPDRPARRVATLLGLLRDRRLLEDVTA